MKNPSKFEVIKYDECTVHKSDCPAGARANVINWLLIDITLPPFLLLFSSSFVVYLQSCWPYRKMVLFYGCQFDCKLLNCYCLRNIFFNNYSV